MTRCDSSRCRDDRDRHATGFATIQDLGRTGHRAVGVPPSGAADRDTLVALNHALGNEPGAAAIECAIGYGTFQATVATTVACGGGECAMTLDGATAAPWRVLHMRRGSVLTLGPVTSGRFLYVAVRGGIDVPLVLGSRSTLEAAALGGYHGRRLQRGDILPVGDTAAGTVGRAARAPARDSTAAIPISRGPQYALFDDAARRALEGATFRISATSNRLGIRLDGATVESAARDDLPSEPTCVGAIQVPGDGAPIVLMHDGPTVGGYPKIAVVREAALGTLAQRAPGSIVRFVLDE